MQWIPAVLASVHICTCRMPVKNKQNNVLVGSQAQSQLSSQERWNFGLGECGGLSVDPGSVDSEWTCSCIRRATYQLFSFAPQVASRSLGIPTSKIYISETSTNTVPNTSPTAASVSADINGMAVHVLILSYLSYWVVSWDSRRWKVDVYLSIA